MPTFAQLTHQAKMKMIKFVAVFGKPEKPTTFIGENASIQMCKSIPEFGVTRLMLVSDKMLLSLGMHEPVVAKLEELGIEVVINDNVVPDPTIEVMEVGISLARAEGVDGVLAFGGGDLPPTASPCC